MKQLIEDYERRLQTAETMLKEKDYSSITQAERIKTKASCYRTFIAELKQQCNIANVVGRSEQLNCDHEWRVDTFDCYGFPTEQYCDKCDKKQAI